MRFLDELKRRHVVRVAVVYGAVAFTILQAAELMVPRLGLPDWVISFFLLVALLGFPMALVLAWAFEITPDGVRRTDAADVTAAGAAAAQASWLSQRAVLAVLSALVLAGSLGWGAGRFAGGKGAAAVIQSVAVLPFINVGGDPENQYFSDGLAEELLTALARVEGLKVAARTSAFALRDRRQDVREVARALGVESVVEGSVQRDEGRGRLRVRAQLVQASDGFQLWSRTFEGSAADVFALQDSLAEAIAGALQVTLGLGADRQARGLTHDVGAYDLYLLGRHHWSARTAGSLQEAIRYYQAAIAKDSSFALAYAGISDAYLIQPFYDFSLTFREAAVRARPYADAALRLAPEVGDVQAAAGLLAYYGDWDFDRASRHLDRAIQLAPSLPWPYHFRRQVRASQGRWVESVADARRGVELDPLSPIIRGGGLAFALITQDSLEAAADQFGVAVRDWSAPPLVWHWYGWTLARLGRHAEAEEAMTRWARAVGYRDPERARVMARAFTTKAVEDSVRALLDDVVATTSADLADLTSEYLAAGTDAYVAAANAAVEERNFWALTLNTPSWLRWEGKSRPDPRIDDLIRRVGLGLGLPDGPPGGR